MNLNRCFPGAPDGTPTQKIADYFQRTLLPMADYVLDYHSGGKTLDFIPFAAAHRLDDGDREAAGARVFDEFPSLHRATLLPPCAASPPSCARCG